METLNLVHAFGFNSQLYFYDIERDDLEIIDYLTVGAFATWKRQEKTLDKPGVKLAIGEIQKDNLSESMAIIGPLLMGGVGVMNMIAPEKLANFYRMSTTCYIPADVHGGGERAVLEAQACGCAIEVEDDNPKLKELVGKSWNEEYYKSQLKTGIESVL